MRHMSFSQTTAQILERTKTVTRRVGWRFLRAGELIQAVEKARGLSKGERIRRLAVLRVVSVRVEPLARLLEDPRYAEDELPREGFPCWGRDEFVEMFRKTHGLRSASEAVTRIEFEYLDG
jgi:hypothetical protein